MEIQSCNCCGYEFEPKDLYEWEDGVPKRKARLCKVCSSSPAGDIYFFPDKYPHETASAAMICWGINYLKDEIRKERRK